jgi:hypothetical protein
MALKTAGKSPFFYFPETYLCPSVEIYHQQFLWDVVPAAVVPAPLKEAAAANPAVPVAGEAPAMC